MAMYAFASLRVTLLAATIFIGMSTADAAEIKVVAAAAGKGAVADLVKSFEKSSGHSVTTTWGGTEGITKRISDGEIADIVIIAAPNIDRLISERKLVSGGRTDFARSGVGVAVRSGLPKPDISSTQALKKAVLDAASVAYSSGPSGFYIAQLFTKMGIDDQVKGKVKRTPSGGQVSELLARGEADLGFQQVSELVHAKGIDYVGPLPAEIQHMTVYSAALHAAAPAPEAARALVKFLTGPDAAPFIIRIGMEPAR